MECRAECETEYICNDCGAIFEKPAEIEDTSWAWGRPEEYILSRCPYCGGDDFSEGVKCGVCGETVSALKAERVNDGYVCEQCIGITGRQAEKALGELFSARELDALRIYIENIYSQGGHLV